MITHKLIATIILTAAAIPAATPAARAQTFQVLYNFGYPPDGDSPWAGLAFDRMGNIYGTTGGGGTAQGGTAFELTPNGTGGWNEAILYNFGGYQADGAGPLGNILVSSDGSLYGTTQEGGTFGFGTVFNLAPNESGGWAETVIYNFDPICCIIPKAHNPYSGLVQDTLGNLYGDGPVYELSLGSNGWTYRTICANGSCAYASYEQLSISRQGYLYGASGVGKYLGGGSVYALVSLGGVWHQYVLYNFGGYPADAADPAHGAIAYDGKGTIYGATFLGGINNCNDTDNACGTIYKLSRQANGQWKETILFNFSNGATGSNPLGGVVLDKAGNLYGTTAYGGSDGAGVVYRLSPNKNGTWTYKVLHSFDNYDGYFPTGDLTIGPDGNLYGTTETGGQYGGGVVFEISRQ